MITELNFAKLTPASFALANANDVDVGVGRSMLLNNIRHGREVDHIMTGLDPEYLPDWAAEKLTQLTGQEQTAPTMGGMTM